MSEGGPKEINPVYRIVGVRTAQASMVALAVHWTFRWPLTGPHALGLFLTPALCLYFLFVFVGRWSWGLPILTRFPTQTQDIALTFDDGPSLETTLPMLDHLKAAGVTATFFVLGEAVDRFPALLKRIVAEGHSVGIHAYSHHPFVLMHRREIRDEIDRTRDAIRRACPEAALTTWLRPPHGFKTFALLRTARRNGCRLAAWNVDSRDYRETSPSRIAQHVLDHLNPGAIILLHDGPTNTATVDALPLILSGMANGGWQTALLPSDREKAP